MWEEEKSWTWDFAVTEYGELISFLHKAKLSLCKSHLPGFRLKFSLYSSTIYIAQTFILFWFEISMFMHSSFLCCWHLFPNIDDSSFCSVFDFKRPEDKYCTTIYKVLVLIGVLLVLSTSLLTNVRFATQLFCWELLIQHCCTDPTLY